MPLAPYFRYIPDRAITQRLILRAASMKDDLADVINVDNGEAAGTGADATTEQVGNPEENKE